MKVLFVGGNFDELGGRSSGVIQKMYETIKDNKNFEIKFFNGGHTSTINNIVKEHSDVEAIIWLAHIENDTQKRNIKELYPNAIFITGKRNDKNKFTLKELMKNTLKMKASLMIELKKQEDGLFHFKLFDAFNNVFYYGTNIKNFTEKLFSSLLF